jgi:hypothetical protein
LTVSEIDLTAHQNDSPAPFLPGGATWTGLDEALDKATIAGLSREIISQLNREELIRVIRAADLPLIDARTRGQLGHFDRTRLEQLAIFARRACQNQGY